MAEKNPDELGALWSKAGAKGEYLTGTINGVAVVCFKNTSDNPKAPQWRVLKAKPRETATVQHEDDRGKPTTASSSKCVDDDIAF